MKAMFKNKHILMFVFLFLFWTIITMNITMETVVIGLLVCFGVVLFTRDFAFGIDEMSLYSFKKFMIFLSFLVHLLGEIIKANIEVAQIVLSPSLPITPTFVKVPINLKKDLNKVIYGNSVTLTPGTLTVDVREDGFIIHTLTASAAEGLKNCTIKKYLLLLEEEKK